MKILIAVTLALLTFMNHSARAAATANVRMYCLSIKFGHASAGGQNALYSLDLTGIENGINGELFPYSDTQPTHASNLILTDDLFDEQSFGAIYLSISDTDNNGDGFPDMFDTSQPFSGTTTGTYNIPGVASGTVTAQWSRNADSSVGTCVLKLKNFGDFYHSFTILEYKGPLTYTPGTNVVTGNVDLALTDMPGVELHGPMQFTKIPEDPHNELTLASGAWTNNAAETYSFLSYPYPITRDLSVLTNYYGGFEFDDGDLTTAEPDYYFWGLSIDDVNDADADGVPDFSDEPHQVPRAPALSLSRDSGNFLLKISADVGQLCELQEASSVDAISWPTILSVTLTNDPQTISLPLSATGAKFWRVHTP